MKIFELSMNNAHSPLASLQLDSVNGDAPDISESNKVYSRLDRRLLNGTPEKCCILLPKCAQASKCQIFNSRR